MNDPFGMSPAWRAHLSARDAHTRDGVPLRDGRRADGAEQPTDAARFRVNPRDTPTHSGLFGQRLGAAGQAIASFWGPLVLIDLIIGLSLTFVAYPVTPALPGGIIIGAFIVLVGAFRRPSLIVRSGGILMMCAVALCAFLVAESMHNGTPWTQRITKFVLLFLVAGTIASGRINIRSVVVGACVGATFNAGAFYAGLTSNNYPPYLTGFYDDKNVAGLYYALWGVLGLMVLPKKWRIPWVAFSLVLVFLTGSRTSMGALILALAWVMLRNRVGVSHRLVLALVGYAGLVYAINHFAETSAYGDRTGTDWYRQQVDAAMAAKAAITPWYGLGLNEGVVVIGQRPQWFHDSYQQAFVEGGYPFLFATLAAFVLLGLGLFDRHLHISRELLVAEASSIVVLVCAWKLGEVFMTLGAFVSLGLCIALRLGIPVDEASPTGHTDVDAPAWSAYLHAKETS